MPQVFSRRAELVVKLALVALFMLVPAFIALALWREAADQRLGEPIAQPIPFSHKHHVGDDGIDCRYCHTTVETDRHAGLPSSQICLSCHSQLYTDAKVLAPLHESLATDTPIAWQRVHQLPDFVYFNHSVHVAKGVACVECHGRVDQMPLTWRAQPLQMQWCLACHRDPGPHLHPPDEVFDPRSKPFSNAADRQALERLLNLENPQRRVECSTCHR